MGKKCDQCMKLYVHKEDLEDSQEEKYLEDKLDESGKPKATIAKHINRG